MLTEQPCKCEDKSRCGGKYTTTEFLMVKADPRWDIQHYHEVLELFAKVFDDGSQ